MRMGEVRKGLRVQLSAAARARHTLPNGTTPIPRIEGTVRSPRPIATRPPYEEGLVVYVVWDGLPTPERWHLIDLDAALNPPSAGGVEDR